MSEETKRDENVTAEEAADDVPETEDAVDGEGVSEDGPVEVSRADYDALQQQVEERDRFRDELLRARADFENYQKRVRRERPNVEDQAVRRLLADLLPVVDNFERALDVEDDATAGAILEGVRMIHSMLLEVLSAHGVETIDADGKPFNPEFHEAVHQLAVDSADQDGTVVEVVQKGYTHKQAVVRASKVVCGKFSGDSSSGTDGVDAMSGEIDPEGNAETNTETKAVADDEGFESP